MNSLNVTDLYKVTKKDIKMCATALAEAFSEDAAMKIMVGDRKNPEKRILELFQFIVRASLKYGHVYATSSKFEGVITWLPENVTTLTEWDFWTHGGIRMILRNGFKMPIAMQKYEDFVHAAHIKHITEPHWYLLQLAVREEYRKSGYTSKMMRPFLDYFDSNGIPCYLETGKGNNEAMYRHYGFELVEKTLIPGTDGVFKAMIRYPQKPGTRI